MAAMRARAAAMTLSLVIFATFTRSHAHTGGTIGCTRERHRTRVGYVHRKPRIQSRAEQAGRPQEREDTPGESTVDPVTYVFGKPGELEEDLGRLGTSPRRVLLGTAGATVLALVANFGGITDTLLSTQPESAQNLRLDSLYSVAGLRGYYTRNYAVRFPSTWLFDQSIAQAQAYRREIQSRRARPSSLQDYDGYDGMSLKGVIPDAAFGPPRGGKYENLSVVKQSVGRVASIDALLGDPEQALRRLLSTSIAPEGSGKSAEVISAKRRADDVFAFEYILSLPNGMKIHTWSLVALQNPRAAAATAASAGVPFDGSAQLFTMTLVAPEDSREDLKPNIVEGVLSGFRLL